jgi:protein SCO1/2
VAGLELELEDQSGRRLSSTTIERDGPRIVSMFYAACGYACPTLIRDLVRIDEALSPATRARTRYLLVTFDPAHDTPAVLSRLAAAHRVPPERWTFARAADDDDTRELAAALGITYRRLTDGNFNHTSVIVAFDRGGSPHARIQGLARDASAFVRTVEELP